MSSSKRRPKSAPSGPGLHNLTTKQEAGEAVLMIVAQLTDAMHQNRWGFAHRLLVVAEAIMTGREASDRDLCKNRPGETEPFPRADTEVTS